VTAVTPSTTDPVVGPTVPKDALNRSKKMQLLHEDLARAHTAQRLEEIQRQQRAVRLVAAHRAQRRAQEAALRARRLLALAVVR
jgi:hypothetical protein